MKKAVSLLLCLMTALFFLPRTAGVAEALSVEGQETVKEMVVYYGSYGAEAEQAVGRLLQRLRVTDPVPADKWQKIMDLWQSVKSGLVLNDGVLPDGLAETDELCLVVLGFQLNPDGSMRSELVERLKVALASANKYPNALVVCTGGGTASQEPSATEAGRMADWLVENGIAPERIIIEDRSLTTAQNAIFTFDLLAQYPQVRQIAIISSDYHIETGTLLFGAEAILRDSGAEIVSNAAWHAPSGSLPAMFQAGALIELSGDAETAFKIYYDTYDIHELPPLRAE